MGGRGDQWREASLSFLRNKSIDEHVSTTKTQLCSVGVEKKVHIYIFF